MPGVRCAGINNPYWPRTLHDEQITGFSPLVCGMRSAPNVWASVDVGGELGAIDVVTMRDGRSMLLVRDAVLRLVSTAGEVVWELPEPGELYYVGDLRGTGQAHLLLGSGPRLWLVDAETGRVEWSHVFEPPHAQVRVAVGNVLPDRSGLEAAVFLAYDGNGCLLHFPQEGDPEFVWERLVVGEGEWPERYDHGCHIQLDLARPELPVIWNVRHHRCRGVCARTGDSLSHIIYEIGGGFRRNYGPWDVGVGPDGQPLICVVADRVQTHVHAVGLRTDGPNELLWQHYYGELYVVPGVATERLAIADLDGDGATEVAYNVRDPEQGFRSFVRVRDAWTGAIEVELADRWGIGAFTAGADGGPSGLLTVAAPNGATPVSGDVSVHGFRGPGDLHELGMVAGARRWGPVVVPGTRETRLLLRETEADRVPVLSQYAVGPEGVRRTASTEAPELLETPVQAVVSQVDGESVWISSGPDGSLAAVAWDRGVRWRLGVSGGPTPCLSAADLDGDGRVELVALTPGDRVQVFAAGKGGSVAALAVYPFLGMRHRNGPLLYDLAGDGSMCLVVPESDEMGEVAVCAYRADGSTLWRTRLGMTTAYNGRAIAWNAGLFLPGPRAGVAVSVNNDLRTIEGTYLLDGLTGEVVWHKGLHWDGDRVRPFLPHGIMTAYDVDGDGLEEVGMDMLSYMAFLNGEDGSFACLYPTRNLDREGGLYAGDLYNSYVPVFETPEADKPHWLVPLGGYGSFGLMCPDPHEGVWMEDPGYDVPKKVGVVDVDGDGVAEAGYVINNSATFCCRDLWTGAARWEVALPEPPNSPVMAADVDGDGKGEFLVGRWCIGTDDAGQGEIRWISPVAMGWAVIADFDGDGLGEIACGGSGKIYILKGE
jgi:hypothetical protein